MTKYEFLGDLSRLIADLPEEDREQAMEYYEDYFADAGPEKEQEIIKDFVSPEFIAEQIRESSAQRLGMTGQASQTSEQAKPASQPVSNQTAATPSKKAIFSRKSAAMAARKQNNNPVPPKNSSAPAATSQPSPQPVLQTAKPAATPTATGGSAPQQAVAQATVPKPSPASPPVAAAERKDSMRNPIFQQDTADKEAEEQAKRDLKKKTKLDIKSIDKNTAAAGKEIAKQLKKEANNSGEDSYQPVEYSSSKKTLLIVLLIVTCPITLSLLAIVLGLFLLGIGAIIGIIVLGIASLLGGVLFFLLSIFSILNINIPNTLFALGTSLLLITIGWLICLFDRYLFTRVLPGAYYGMQTWIKGVRSKLKRFTLK